MIPYTELKTPDGNALKFRGFGKEGPDRGGEQAWFRTRLTDKLLNAKSKKRCPIISGWNGGRQRLIFLDYDAKDDAGRAHAEYLCIEAAARYTNCFAFRSVSGNWRAAFLVDSETVPTTGQAKAYLNSKLPKDGRWYDPAGLSRLYVNKEVVKQMQAGLAKLESCEPLLPGLPASLRRQATTEQASEGGGEEESERGYNTIINKPTRTHTYYQADMTQLPDIEHLEGSLEWFDPQDTHSGLLRILTACWALASDKGFNLPLNNLAEQLNCSPMQVSRMLKELVNLGLLTCVDHSYARNRKAKTYKAKAALWRAIQAHKQDYLANKPLRTNPLTITTIEDGKFYPLALRLLNQFKSEESYIKHLQSLTNINDTRIREGRKYFRYHLQTLERQAA